jgi:coproporphyrinogen III oxidase-like Fe-S oxidoreductase
LKRVIFEKLVLLIVTEVLPYDKLEHWPPMTYRNNALPSAEMLLEFKNYLNRENNIKGPKELQPWIPFCDGRCSFCYFPVNCNEQIYSPYLKAMKKVLSLYSKSEYVKSSIFTELYIGGGSPSVLNEDQIIDLLRFCRKNFNFKDSMTKFTACTNNLTSKKISLFSRENVSQLDIGVQTFNEQMRKTLNLRDTGSEAFSKIKDAKRNGLGVSIDLLYNLPGQTLEQLGEDLKQALELDVESVDCYPLELYSETSLAKKILQGHLPTAGDYKKELEMYKFTYKLFKDNGYFPTCHNRFSRLKQDREPPASEVIGTGAGFFMGLLGPYIYSDIEKVEEYIEAAKNQSFPISRFATLSPEDEMRKMMMMIYVRMPVNRKDFKVKFGRYPEEAFPEAFEELRSKELIIEENDEIRLSEKGDPWRFNIAWEFFKYRS